MANKIDLTKVTTKFGKAYDQAAKADAAKIAAQTEFFSAIDKVLEHHVRKQLIVEHTNTDLAAEVFVDQYYPGYRLVSQSESGLMIEEDPHFMKYSYVNPVDKKVYARTIAQGGRSLDDDRLREEDPELWEAVTEWPEPWFSLIYDFTYEDWLSNHGNWEDPSGDKDKFEQELGKYLTEKGLQKTLKDPNRWTQEEFDKVNKYMVPGRVSTRLVKPREATPEELESL